MARMELSLEEIVVLSCAANKSKADIALEATGLLSSPKFDFMIISKIIDELVQRNLIVKEGTSLYYMNDNGKEAVQKNYEALQLLMLSIWQKVN